MSRFQPEIENLEQRQLLAADVDFGLDQVDAGDVVFAGLRFAAESSPMEICLKTSLRWNSAEEFDATSLAEQLVADENAWSVESLVATNEELIFALGDSFRPDLSDIS